jgi:SAM-dependent methyltransferase
MSASPRPGPAYFDALFEASDDPWKYKDRWYEQRKRALTLACLPQRRYASGYEPGCANGELSAALAERCDRLLISDGTTAAVDIAKRRVSALPNVRVTEAWMPHQWPRESFDLIVISEFGYYLDAPSLRTLAIQARESLEPGGTVLACHWRWLIDGCEMDGDAVHHVLAENLGLSKLCNVLEPDLVIDVWCADTRSVAQRGGLV